MRWLDSPTFETTTHVTDAESKKMLKTGERVPRFACGLLIAVALLCAAHDGFAQGPQIAGTVVSRQDGQPVANATVTIEGGSLTAVTGAAGRFRVDGTPRDALRSP